MGFHKLSLRQATPQTQQETSYVTNDDGTYEKGIGPRPRFIDNGDGTVSDLSTGLMWVKAPAKMIPGSDGNVNASNTILAAKNNWANNTSYIVADLAKDNVISPVSFWVCKTAHTSVADTAAWNFSTSYTIGQIRKDSVEGTYWECDVAHTSPADFSDWAPNTEYTESTSIVKDPANSTYYQCASSHTSRSTASSWTESNYYSEFDVVDVGGTIYQCTSSHTSSSMAGISDWAGSTGYFIGNYVKYYTGVDTIIYICNSDHTSGSDFTTDYNNGLWSSLGSSAFVLDSAYWASRISLFEAERVQNVGYWTDAGTSAFAIDRVLNFARWSSSPNIYTFEADRTANPTYWVQTTWTNRADYLGYGTTRTMANHITACEALEYAGYTDWRMPNIEELKSICYHGANSNSEWASWYGDFVNSTTSSSTTAVYNTDTTKSYGLVPSTQVMQIQRLNKTNGYITIPVRNI